MKTTTIVSLRTNRQNRVRGVNRKSGLRNILAASIGALLGVTAASNAATFTYDDGGGTLNWADANNWNPNAAPTVTGAPGHDLVFSVQTLGVPARTATNDLLTNVNSITFGGQAFLLNGNAITLAGGGITNNSALTQTLSFGGTGITLGANQTWNAAAGQLNVTSALNTGGNSLFFTGAQNTTLGGNISGNGSFIQNGTGNVIVNGTDTGSTGSGINSGTLTVNGSLNNTMNVTGGTLAGTGSVGNISLSNGGTVNFGAGAVGQANFGVSGTGGNWNGLGTIAVNANVAGGNLNIGAAGNLTTTAGMNVSGTATISASGPASRITGSVNVTSTGISTFQGIIAGAGTVTVNNGSAGSGAALILTGANTYTGVTTVTSGFLRIDNATGLGTTAGGTVVQSGGTLGLNGVAIGNEALTLNGVGTNNFAGGVLGALLNAGGSSSYAGAITLGSSSAIQVNSGTTLTLTGGVVKNGVTLTLSGRLGGGGGGTLNINTVGISGAAANSDLIVDSLTVNENVANTYNGPTFIRSTLGAGTGILNANVLNALPTANGRTAVTMDDGGSLGASRLNLGANQSVASLASTTTGAASSLINLSATGVNTLTVGTAAGTTTFAGIISGAGAGANLIKDGASTQILSGQSTYGGTTTILSGTLQTGINNALPVGTAVTVGDATTLAGPPAAALTIGAGFSQAIASLTLVAGGSTNVNINAGSTLQVNGNISLVNNAVAPGNGFNGNINGPGFLDLGLAVRNFNVASQNIGQGQDLRISAIIQNGGVNVNGTNSATQGTIGGVEFSGANTYAGLTTINSGILRAANNSALGANGAGNPANGTVVNVGGTLMLAGGITIGNEALTLNGLGAAQTAPQPNTAPIGALAGSGGTATYGGQITIGSTNTVITAGNGNTLNLTGGIVKNGVNLIIGNIAPGAVTATSGTVNIGVAGNNATGIIGTSGVNSFNSDVLYTAGTTNLLVANPYLGATWLNNGAVVNATVAGALPSLVGDGGIAATRTALIMDADGSAFFGAANFPTSPLGATLSTGGSTLNLGASQAVQFIASGPTTSLTTRINMGNFGLTVGTSVGTPGFVSPATFAGVITGTNAILGLTKDGTSTQIVTGVNTYIGFTAINAGTLQVGNGSAAGPASQLGTGLVLLAPGAVLDIDLKNGGSFNNVVQTAAGSTVRGINGNVNANSLGAAGDVQTITQTINGGANFIQNGGGTTIFANTNTYGGGTLITGATSNLTVGTLASGGTAGANIALNTVKVEAGGTFQLVNVAGGVLNNNIDNTAAGSIGTVLVTSTFSTTLNGTLTNTGAGSTLALTQNGAGTTFLTNAGNTYTGPTTVSLGTLQVGTAGLVGSVGNQAPATGIVVSTGGTLAIVNTTGNALANNITNGVGGTGTVIVNSANTNTLSGTLTNGALGALALTQSGTGTTILTHVGNSYTGATTISGGTLQLGTVALQGSIGAANVNLGTGGTLAVVNVGPTIAVLLNNIQNNLGGTGLINNSSTAVVGFFGNILDGVGSLAFTQSGTGESFLVGNNTYSGVTNVTGGTVILGTNTALGTAAGGTVVAAGATLDLNGQNVAAEAVQIQGTGNAAGILFPQIAALSNSGLAVATLGGPVTLVASASIGSASGLGGITLTNTVSGGAGAILTKVGTDTLTLNGINSYSGATVINAGIVIAGNASALGSIGAGTTVTGTGAALLIANGILVNAEPLNITGTGAGPAAPGALTKAAGTLAVPTNATFNGPITVGVGGATINSNGPGTLTLNGPINKNGVNLTLAGTGGAGSAITVNGVISGNTGLLNSDLIVNGTTVNLNAANTYLGQTFITSIVAGDGIVNANVASALPTSPIRTQLIMDAVAAGNVPVAAGAGASVLNVNVSQSIASLTSVAGSLVNLGTNTLTIGFGTANVTPGYVNSNFAGIITGANAAGASIIKDESSIQILSGPNTYNGTTTVNGGTLKAGVASVANVSGAFGKNSAVIMANTLGAVLDITGFNTQIGSITGGGAAGGNVTLGAATLTTGGDGTSPAAYAGVISGTGGVTKILGGTQIFSGPNTYSGTTTVNGGTLKAGVASVANASGAFGNNSAVVMANTAGAVLDITGFNTQIGSITGGGAAGGNVTLGAAILTTGGDNTSPAVYAGAISGTGQLIKIGTGTQILGPTVAGGNTYTGLTTIRRGTLSLAGGQAIANPSLLTPTAGAVLIAPVTAGHNGTLNLASSETIGSLSDAGAVALSTTTVALNTNTLTLGVATINPLGATTFGGTITSTGVGNAVVKNGADTFTLSGSTSTYTGGTTLNGGTLNINNSSVGGPVGGPPVTGPVGTGTLTINAANNGALGGNTIGTTSVALAGNTIANAVTLNASFNVSNLQAGIPNVNPLPAANGTIGAQTSSGVTFSGPVNVNAANVTITTQSGFLDLTGVVSGAVGNGLTFAGATYSLIGAGTAAEVVNGYGGITGLTTVQSGYVLLNKGAGGAIPGNLTINAGALVQTTNVAPNQIAVQSNAIVNGVLDLAGANQTLASLTGAGSVRLDNSVFNGGPATAAAIFTVDSGSFTGTIVDSGPGAGSGQVVKNTAGTLALLGASTYTGGTTLNLGTLQAGNTKAFGSGNLTVNGGTLQTVGGPLVVNIGAGNVAINGGTVVANVGGTLPGVNHDQILTTGNVGAIGGTLALVRNNGYLLAPGDKVNLVQAGTVAGGSVNGTAVPNASVTGLNNFSNTPLLIPTVNLYLTTVTLEAMQGLFANNPLITAQIGNFTPNQLAVARALDSVSAKNLFKTGVVKELNFLDTQPLNTLRGNLDKIAPEELTSIFSISAALANVNSANLQRRMEDLRQGGGSVIPASAPANDGTRYLGGSRGPVGRRSKEIAAPSNDQWGMFLTGSGEFTHIGSTTNAAGFTLNTGGVTAGLDYKVSRNFAVGLNLGYANTTASLENGGSLDADGGRIGLYATYFDDNFHIDAAVSGGINSYRTRRVTPNNTVATGSPDGSEFSMLIAAGYDWKFGGLTVGPTASYQYTNMSMDGFREIGAFAPLNVGGRSFDSSRTALGIRAIYDGHIGRVGFRPEVRLAWQHEFGANAYSVTSSFATLGGNPFTVTGPATGRDSLLASAGFMILWNDRFGTYVYYDGNIGGQNYESHNISGGFRLQF